MALVPEIRARFNAVDPQLALYGIEPMSRTLSATIAQPRFLATLLALGASRSSVMGSVVGEGLKLAGIGLALGLVAALAGAQLLGSLVFGVTTTDPTTFIAVALLVLGTAALATTAPAWRAANADPAGALRAE